MKKSRRPIVVKRIRMSAFNDFAASHLHYEGSAFVYREPDVTVWVWPNGAGTVDAKIILNRNRPKVQREAKALEADLRKLKR